MSQTDSKGALFRVRGGVELHHVRNVARCFAPHFHDEWQIMVLTEGALSLQVDGAAHEASTHAVCAIGSGQVHGGSTDGWGWECRIFYPPPALMDDIASEMGLGAVAVSRPVLYDAALAGSLVAAHASCDDDADDLRQAFALLLARQARRRDRAPRPASTRRAEACIKRRFAEKLSLDELAALARLSRFHFLRVFAREWGLTPHAYQMQVRLAHALRRLRQGASAAEAAHEAGYADQSHLIRTLRRSHALTPAQIQRAH